MIDLTDKVVGVWFTVLTDTSDWMGCLTEIEPEKKYEIAYRHRYYEDHKAFDSADRKSWYKGTTETTRASAIASMRAVLQKMRDSGVAKGPSYELINEGDFGAFLKKFFEMPFVFARKDSPEGVPQ